MAHLFGRSDQSLNSDPGHYPGPESLCPLPLGQKSPNLFRCPGLCGPLLVGLSESTPVTDVPFLHPSEQSPRQEAENKDQNQKGIAMLIG